MKNIKERFLKLLNLKIDKPDIKTNINKEKLDEDKIRKIVSEEIIKHKKIEYEKITVEKFLKMFFIILLVLLNAYNFLNNNFSLFGYMYLIIATNAIGWEYIPSSFKTNTKDNNISTIIKTIGVITTVFPIFLLIVLYILHI